MTTTVLQAVERKTAELNSSILPKDVKVVPFYDRSELIQLTTRTVDQTIQARFWGAPIWNYWNEIAQSVVVARSSGIATAARLFAALNLAFADAVIAFYDAKYHYRVWRPITAVRLADGDGNAGTTADPAWNPLATTPAGAAHYRTVRGNQG